VPCAPHRELAGRVARAGSPEHIADRRRREPAG
jgi:hypothetical protein